MRVKVTGAPSYAMANITLAYGEVVFVERGSIALLSGGLDLKATFGGDGIAKAVKRRLLGGESLIFTEAVAEVENAWISVTPPYPGDVIAINIDEADPLLIESGSLLAYSKGVLGDVHYSGVKTVLLHEGITMLEATGTGLAIVSAVGAIEQMALQEGEQLIVDTGHLVGFSATVRFDVGALSSLATAALSGEGIVARLTGPGVVYVQTRGEQRLREWLFPSRDQMTGPRV